MAKAKQKGLTLGKVEQVIRGVRYSTTGAMLLAHDALRLMDGKPNDDVEWLLKTPKGNYFSVRRSSYQSNRVSLRPLTKEEALTLWDSLEVRAVSFKTAFGYDIEEA